MKRELHGSVGVQQVEVNAGGRTLRVLSESPPVQGQQSAFNHRFQAAEGRRGGVR